MKIYKNKPSFSTKMQNTGNKGFHDIYFLREYLFKSKDHKYFTTPPANDYLTQRQKGSLEGMAESLYQLNNFKPAPNTTYGRAGTDDIASKLGLYNPTNLDLYQPKRNSYLKEKDQYLG